MDTQGEKNDLEFASQAPLAESTQGLVGMNRSEKEKLPHTFLSAAKKAASLKEMADEAKGEEKLQIELEMRDEHKKASVTACRLSILNREFIQGLHDDLVSALKDPNILDLEGLGLAIAYEKVLIEQEIIRNGKIFEIAEAIADGLAKTKDTEKQKIMTQFGLEIMCVLPGGSGGDIARVYSAVFAIAKHPYRIKSYSGVLNSRLERLKDDPNLKRLLNDTVIQRMEQVLELLDKKEKDDANQGRKQAQDAGQLPNDGINLPRRRISPPRSRQSKPTMIKVWQDIQRGISKPRKAHSG